MKDDKQAMPNEDTPRCRTIVSCGNYLHTTRCNRAAAVLKLAIAEEKPSDIVEK